MIVDTHVHVVTDDRVRYPGVADTARAGSIPTIKEIGQTEWPLTTAEILLAELDAAKVAKATLVQSYFVYEYDNSYAIDSANAHPDRFVSIVTLDPTSPAAPDQLSAVVEQGARGIRFMRGRLPRCTLGDPETLGLWKRIEDLQIPLCIHDKVEELVRLPAVLERFPNVTVAMDHGWGHKVGEPPYDLLSPLFALARFPNIRVKTAINNIQAARGATSTPKIFYEKLIDVFGANRIMWSSNYPAHPQFGSIASRLAVAQEELAFLDQTSRNWIFGDTALSVWPWLK